MAAKRRRMDSPCASTKPCRVDAVRDRRNPLMDIDNLRLGITEQGLRDFASRIGWPANYRRRETWIHDYDVKDVEITPTSWIGATCRDVIRALDGPHHRTQIGDEDVLLVFGSYKRVGFLHGCHHYCCHGRAGSSTLYCEDERWVMKHVAPDLKHIALFQCTEINEGHTSNSPPRRATWNCISLRKREEERSSASHFTQIAGIGFIQVTLEILAVDTGAPLSTATLNGYDFTEHLKTWMRNEGHADKSAVELLVQERSSEVGFADVLLSHAQSESWDQTLWNMTHACLFPELVGPGYTLNVAGPIVLDRMPFIFVDYICINQCADEDFELDRVRDCLKDIKRTLAAVELNSYPARTYCMFELFESIKNGLEVQMIMVGTDKAKQHAMFRALFLGRVDVDVKDSKCRDADDQGKIMKSMKRYGFAQVNETIHQKMQQAWCGIAVTCQEEGGRDDFLATDDWVSMVLHLLRFTDGQWRNGQWRNWLRDMQTTGFPLPQFANVPPLAGADPQESWELQYARCTLR